MHTTYTNLYKEIVVSQPHRIYFTEGVFDAGNGLLKDVLELYQSHGPLKVVVVLDSGVEEAHTFLREAIEVYQKRFSYLLDVKAILTIPGGEVCKNESTSYKKILTLLDKEGICRHSFLIAIGGGAVLDTAGFAAATAHRGIRLIRIPTTVLSQNDSGIGVKNGINYFGKKNFLGSFAVPVAVINDWNFLKTLSHRDWISGLAEAVKVALIKDLGFFEYLEEHAISLFNRDTQCMKYVIWKCASLHLEHIAGKDPFEQGSSRPLDYGHWSAHKIEQLTKFRIRHGEAVAMGIALDNAYAVEMGLLAEADECRVRSVLETCGFNLRIPSEVTYEALCHGLKEFSEHLGGELTLAMLTQPGMMTEVHEIELSKLHQAFLKYTSSESTEPTYYAY